MHLKVSCDKLSLKHDTVIYIILRFDMEFNGEEKK